MLKAQLQGSDGMIRVYKIGGLFGVKMIGGMVALGDGDYKIDPKYYYRRRFRPWYPPYFLIRYKEYFCIDFKEGNPNPIDRFKEGDYVPLPCNPSVIQGMRQSWAWAKVLRKPGMDTSTIVILILGLLVLVLGVGLAVKG